MIAIKKLLVPTDFGEHSKFALKYAVELAKSFEAKVYVLHVHDPYPQGAAFEGMYYDPDLIEGSRKKANEILCSLVGELQAQHIDAEPVLLNGRPPVEIIRQAGELDVDLIVIATHGRKGISHVIFGSTAEKVVRLAPCPVLTVKHPEHDFVE